jgi:hypothetical protein
MVIQWLSSCLALTKMRGLKNLEIELWNETRQKVLEEKMLKGLENVKVVEGGSFVVRLPWVEEDAIVIAEREVLGGYRIERRWIADEPVSCDVFQFTPLGS